MTSTGILPTYQRFVNGVPVPSFSRRSFRPREKYLILLVFLTFGVVCFGAFFFLPEFRSSGSTVNNSVYKVYQHMQKAGPELLIPAPPHLDDLDVPNLIRHDDHKLLDPHFLEDRDRLQAKIEEDQALKVLERPNIDFPLKPSSSLAPKENGLLDLPIVDNVDNAIGEQIDDDILDSYPIVTVPPAPSNHYPDVNRGEDKDPVARERRDKVKEVSHSP